MLPNHEASYIKSKKFGIFIPSNKVMLVVFKEKFEMEPMNISVIKFFQNKLLLNAKFFSDIQNIYISMPQTKPKLTLEIRNCNFSQLLLHFAQKYELQTMMSNMP